MSRSVSNERLTGSSFDLAHHSLLITHHSSLITHHSLLITHYSLLITHYSLLITHHSLFSYKATPLLHANRAGRSSKKHRAPRQSLPNSDRRSSEAERPDSCADRARP